MHEAEQYLRNPANPPSLYVIIGGKRRKLFINRDVETIGILAPRKKRYGYVFNAWDSIEKICNPTRKKVISVEDRQRKLILKYQKLAAKASFSNIYTRSIVNADPAKSLFENGITTGTRIDGQVISLETIRKWCGESYYQQFKDALKEKRPFNSGRFNFRGYDGSLWIAVYKNEDGIDEINAGFSKEFRNCGNGYYYLLINDDNFIGYDID